MSAVTEKEISTSSVYLCKEGSGLNETIAALEAQLQRLKEFRQKQEQAALAEKIALSRIEPELHDWRPDLAAKETERSSPTRPANPGCAKEPKTKGHGDLDTQFTKQLYWGVCQLHRRAINTLMDQVRQGILGRELTDVDKDAWNAYVDDLPKPHRGLSASQLSLTKFTPTALPQPDARAYRYPPLRLDAIAQAVMEQAGEVWQDYSELFRFAYGCEVWDAFPYPGLYNQRLSTRTSDLKCS